MANDDDPEVLRHELRAWLEVHLTPEVRAALAVSDADARWEAHRAWNATLVDGGWGAVAWPVQHGGRDAGLAAQLAYHEEMSRAGAPGPVNAIGVANIAPAIMAFGTPEQQERFLRPMLRGDEIWSQGMSEPGAGSDLASLRSRAVVDGDHLVVDGQKTWTSNGDRAHWCQLFVRTDPSVPKHQGISCVLVDMATPGIEARPVTTMAGDAGFAEVFFDAVRVPASALLGGLGEGWRVATRTLGSERAGVAPLYLSLRRKLDRLLADLHGPADADADAAEAEAEAEARARAGPGRGRSPVLDDPRARQALAARHTEARVLELLATRTLAAALAGRTPGPEGSVIKLAWSQAEQALATTAVDLLGLPALDGPWATGLLSSRSLSIAGGTTEVNKTIVGERVLGLPKEPT